MKSFPAIITNASVIAVLATAMAFGQSDAPASTRAKDSPIVTQDVNPRLKAQITMRAKDASLSEVLQVLAERSGMNFVTGEGVYREKITIILNKTPVDEAIDLVVRAAGLSYEIVGNSVLIAEPDKLKGEVGQQGYVIALKYANAVEVQKMLGDLTKYVQVDQGGNRLICFTSPRVINEIERMVKSIDHPHILVQLETRLVEVQITNANKYGIDWARLATIQSAGSANAAASLASAALGGGTAGGTGAATGTGATGSSVGAAGGTGMLAHPSVPLRSGYNLNWWSLGPLNFDIALDLMIANGDARLLMNSKLTTTNNREASLHIGEKIPYLVQSYNMGATGGGGANQQLQKEETGIKLNMTPTVNEDHQVTLNVEPEVSNVTDFIGAANLPRVSVRKTKTTVRVEDGQTIFLAGLLREEKVTKIDKVPVLGEIPLIGLLFQHRREEMVKTNLILEITPRIIHDSAELSVGATQPRTATEPRQESVPAPAQQSAPAPAPAPAGGKAAQ